MSERQKDTIPLREHKKLWYELVFNSWENTILDMFNMVPDKPRTVFKHCEICAEIEHHQIGFVNISYKGKHLVKVVFKYCPNCGAPLRWGE